MAKEYHRYKVRTLKGNQEKSVDIITSIDEDELRDILNFQCEIVKNQKYKGKIIGE